MRVYVHITVASTGEAHTRAHRLPPAGQEGHTADCRGTDTGLGGMRPPHFTPELLDLKKIFFYNENLCKNAYETVSSKKTYKTRDIILQCDLLSGSQGWQEVRRGQPKLLVVREGFLEKEASELSEDVSP